MIYETPRDRKGVRNSPVVPTLPRRDDATICASGMVHAIPRICERPGTFLNKNTTTVHEHRSCEDQGGEQLRGEEGALKHHDVAVRVRKGASEDLKSCNCVRIGIHL